uniref:DUF2982 domain-containing protein n=1 Tax=Ningiella ruwaisensis TaxID=2364274 RepID=UPI00109F4635|nr:DUF2982 domain-containing protein [Ningiella ruwaisensis]
MSSSEVSTNENEDAIFIRGISATNGLTTLLIGSAGVSLGAIMIVFLPPLFFLAGVLIIAAGIIALTMGFFKIREPKYSLEITRESVTYHHRLGRWTLHWENIQRVDVPRVHRGFEHVDLEMVGFRLKEPERFLSQISPRLITHLLMEQRPLVAQIERSNCEGGRCYGDDLIEDAKYKTKEGTILRGVTAMFANRMRKLQTGLGYDVFISTNELDRSAEEFVMLIRECHDNVKQLQIEKVSN